MDAMQLQFMNVALLLRLVAVFCAWWKDLPEREGRAEVERMLRKPFHAHFYTSRFSCLRRFHRTA